MHCKDDGYTQCAAGPRDTGFTRTVTLTRTQAWITAALSALMIDAEAAAEEVEDAVLCCLCRMYRKPRRPAAAETKTAAPLEDIQIAEARKSRSQKGLREPDVFWCFTSYAVEVKKGGGATLTANGGLKEAKEAAEAATEAVAEAVAGAGGGGGRGGWQSSSHTISYPHPQPPPPTPRTHLLNTVPPRPLL